MKRALLQFIVTCVVLTLLMFSGCSSRTCFISGLYISTAESSSGSYQDIGGISSYYAKESAELGTIPPGSCRIVMFRPNRLWGNAVDTWILVEGSGLISIQNGGCIAWEEPAGPCTLYQFPRDGVTFIRTLSFKTQELETYYIDLNVELGEMIILNPKTGRKWLKKYTPITNPAPEAWRKTWNKVRIIK